jgi:isoleucyl-tRNA synthetase
LGQLIDEVSNWYLRRSRRRYWARAGASRASDADKNAAYATLHEVLTTLIRLLAPFTPFVTEAMYQNLVRSVDPQAPASVHHCLWPRPAPKKVDRKLSAEMALVMRLASLGHAARNKANRKLRQPLSEAAFAVGRAEEGAVLSRYADLLADELNVKRVRLLDAASEAVDFRLNPYPRQLGQKFGSRFPAVREAILALDPQEAGGRLLAGQPLQIDVGGEPVEILPEEVEVRIEAHAGFEAVADGPYVAALKTEITPELHAEGLAREFVRRVQEQRKASGLEIADRIHLAYRASPALRHALETYRAYVKGELLAREVDADGRGEGEFQDYSFDGESARVWLRKEP